MDRLRSQRDEARAMLDRTKRQLAEFAHGPVDGTRPLSPDELIDRIWGGNPYENVLRDSPRDSVARRRSRAIPSGEELYQKLGITSVDARYEFDFRLMGLRQLRDPENLPAASLQQVIRTQLQFNTLPWPILEQYRVKVDPVCDIAQLLGLETQTVPITQTFAYPGWMGVTADFGAKVEVLPS